MQTSEKRGRVVKKRASEIRWEERRGQPVRFFSKYLSPPTIPPTSRRHDMSCEITNVKMYSVGRIYTLAMFV